MNKASLLFIFGLLTLLILSCGEDPYPKPRAFPRIDLPAHTYQTFESATCPFSFEFPKIGEVEGMLNDSCLINLHFPEYDFKWHITYRHIPSSGRSRSQHEEEYLRLVSQHLKKLSHISEIELEFENGWGTLFEMKGNVGGPAQMLFGDSTHLILTACYFRTAVNQDSLGPLIDFMKEDMIHLAESIEW